MPLDAVVSAAAEAPQAAILNGRASPVSSRFGLDALQDTNGDALMEGSSDTVASVPQTLPGNVTSANFSSLRAGTPKTAIGDGTSRATSQHPEAGLSMPAEAPSHGAPTRQYLNSKVTGALLEGMKHLARDQPMDPLRVLGEYLITKSKEGEGQ